MKSGIYKIVNIVTNKAYVGSGAIIKGRWSHHRHGLRKGNHGNAYLQRSWNKHGEENFKFEILEFVEDKLKMPEKEYEWMIKLNSLIPTGYNIAVLTNSGYTHNEVSRAKMSIIQKNKTMSEEAKAKISKAHKGMKKPRTVPFSEEHKARLRLARVGMKFSEQHKKNLGKPDKWPCSDGWRCKCDSCNLKRNEIARENHFKRQARKLAA